MKHSKKGGVIDFDIAKIERLVAQGILQKQIPIRGKELKLLRSVANLSMGKFSAKIGLSSSAIFYWEQSGDIQLIRINEIAVRLLCAEILSVELPGVFSQLIGDERHEPLIVAITSKKPNKKRS